jgi:two-component system nitrate/nitrite response regulator NarL
VDTTARQREIVQLVAQGLSTKEIARRLNITEGTVKLRLRKLYDRVGVRNRTALTALVRKAPIG